MANLKQNNDMAVSPIVATLVLIVVAVIGAVAVGTIMGTFSTDVSKQASSQNAAGASQTEILVAGSTTVDPVTQAVGKLYTTANPGVKITSQATGSGAGFQAVTLGVADIGAMSEAPSTTQMTQNPSAQKFRIGSGVVALIMNKTDAVSTPVAIGDIYTLYSTNTGAGTTANFVAISRADSSGTADTFAKWIGLSGQSAISSNVKKVSGNANLVSTVASTPMGFGFADYGYVAGASGITMVDYTDAIKTTGYVANSLNFDYANLTKTAQYQYRSTEEKNPDGTYVQKNDQTNGAAKYYNLSLVHPLYYITNGNPTTLQKDYIDFTRSASAKQGFVQTNTWNIADLL
jgi:phosphate transport system substrate-binding protein